jgi:hypothetical protein
MALTSLRTGIVSRGQTCTGVEGAGLAYDAHEAPKVLVRYEELRADTLSEMRRIYSALLRRLIELYGTLPKSRKSC